MPRLTKVGALLAGFLLCVSCADSAAPRPRPARVSAIAHYCTDDGGDPGECDIPSGDPPPPPPGHITNPYTHFDFNSMGALSYSFMIDADGVMSSGTSVSYYMSGIGYQSLGPFGCSQAGNECSGSPDSFSENFFCDRFHYEGNANTNHRVKWSNNSSSYAWSGDYSSCGTSRPMKDAQGGSVNCSTDLIRITVGWEILWQGYSTVCTPDKPTDELV